MLTKIRPVVPVLSMPWETGGGYDVAGLDRQTALSVAENDLVGLGVAIDDLVAIVAGSGPTWGSLDLDGGDSSTVAAAWHDLLNVQVGKVI
jgi:hypothetical protein